MTVPSSPPPFRKYPSALLWAAAAFLALAYFAVAAFHVAYGSMNADEGFYAAAARAVWRGEMPYRDFGFTQTPLVAYVNALAMRLTGFGLFEQRSVNGVWGVFALLLAARLVLRRSGAGWALLFVALFTVSPAWMYFVNLGKTYGLTSLLATAMTTVYLEGKPGWKKMAALSAIGVLGVACRLPAAPFFGVLWLAGLGDGGGFRSARQVSLALLFLIACSALFLLPFYLAAPEQSLFWTIDFHRISVPKKDWRLRWGEIVTLAPAVWSVALLALTMGVVAGRRWRQREAAVLVAASVALAVNLLPRGVYEEYGVPFLPPLAAGSFILLAQVVAKWSRLKSWLISGALLLGPFAFIPAVNWSHLKPVQRQLPSVWLPANARPYNYELPGNLHRATEVVKRLLPPGEFFIGPNIILAIEADRPIPPTARMGPFTMTSDYDTATAERLHLMTYTAFEKRLRDIDLPIVGLHTQQVFNYAWSVPSFNFQTPEEASEWGSVLTRYFVPAHEDADFVVLARPHILLQAAPR